jgi:hypothetical protein
VMKKVMTTTIIQTSEEWLGNGTPGAFSSTLSCLVVCSALLTCELDYLIQRLPHVSVSCAKLIWAIVCTPGRLSSYPHDQSHSTIRSCQLLEFKATSIPSSLVSTNNPHCPGSPRSKPATLASRIKPGYIMARSWLQLHNPSSPPIPTPTLRVVRHTPH